jgi:hypothetical protein
MPSSAIINFDAGGVLGVRAASRHRGTSGLRRHTRGSMPVGLVFASIARGLAVRGGPEVAPGDTGALDENRRKTRRVRSASTDVGDRDVARLVEDCRDWARHVRPDGGGAPRSPLILTALAKGLTSDGAGHITTVDPTPGAVRRRARPASHRGRHLW